MATSKCKKEERAFNKAEGRVGYYEQRFDEWERKAVLSEWQAEQYLADLGNNCEDEECYVDGWLTYKVLLERSQKYRAFAEHSQSQWEQAIRDEEKAKDKYHRCLDRQKSR